MRLIITIRQVYLYQTVPTYKLASFPGPGNGATFTVAHITLLRWQLLNPYWQLLTPSIPPKKVFHRNDWRETHLLSTASPHAAR